MTQQQEVRLYNGRTIPMLALGNEFPVAANQLPFTDLLAKGVPLKDDEPVEAIGVSKPRLTVVVLRCKSGQIFTVVLDRLRLTPPFKSWVAAAIQSLEVD